jgi:saccharopine dehydrogenase-like NADP-dependent oxidoreductase
MAALLALLALGAATAPPWRAVVVGGNGRVGGSTVRWLLRRAREESQPLHVVVGGRSRGNFERLCRSLGLAPSDECISFAALDLDDPASLDAALAGADVCVHTAGPFQSVEHPSCLAAAVRNGVAYCDVCDNTALAQTGRRAFDDPAQAAGVPAVLACGIWPGVCETEHMLCYGPFHTLT